MIGGTQIQRNYLGFWKFQSPNLSLREHAQKVSLLVLFLSRYAQLLCKILTGHLAILILHFYVNTAAFEWQNPQKEGDSLNTVDVSIFPRY